MDAITLEAEGKMDGDIAVEAVPEIRITIHDQHRLETLVRRLDGASPQDRWALLRAEIDRAVLVDDPDSEPPFVRIGSALAFRDESGRVYEGTLTLPGQGLERPDAISIVTPVGAALLGLSEGQSVQFRTADGRNRTCTVLKIFRDEAPELPIESGGGEGR